MAAIDDAKADLQFVRETVQRAESPISPALNILWAAIMLAGSVLADLWPFWVGRYWLVAAPFGFVVSAVLGYRWQQHVGQMNLETGRNEFWHWGAMLGAVALAVPLVVAHRLTPRGLGSVILLIVAVSYVQAGIHLHRSRVWVGLLMAGGYLLTVFVAPYGWTLAGILSALALIGHAFLDWRGDATR